MERELQTFVETVRRGRNYRENVIPGAQLPVDENSIFFLKYNH